MTKLNTSQEVIPPPQGLLFNGFIAQWDYWLETPRWVMPGASMARANEVVPDTGYLVPYRVKPELNQIQLLRVFHTSRKLPQR